MARFDCAAWRPLLPENTTQPPIRPTQVILHSTAVDAPISSTRSYFDRGDVGVESHFGVGFDGEIQQWIDTERSADANLKANRRPDGTGAISVETQGGDVDEPWTDAQLGSILLICEEAHERHGIPYVQIPSPDEPGYGWHVMFGAPGPWTTVVGKTCPQPKRIAQFKSVILPYLNQPKTPNEEPVTPAEIVAIRDAVLTAPIGRLDLNLAQLLEASYKAAGQVPALTKLVLTLKAELDDVQAKVTAAAAGVPTVDLDALAAKVADTLALRLQG